MACTVKISNFGDAVFYILPLFGEGLHLMCEKDAGLFVQGKSGFQKV
jgi:hypothetical protein